jgi:hypothetical protein
MPEVVTQKFDPETAENFEDVSAHIKKFSRSESYKPSY